MKTSLNYGKPIDPNKDLCIVIVGVGWDTSAGLCKIVLNRKKSNNKGDRFVKKFLAHYIKFYVGELVENLYK